MYEQEHELIEAWRNCSRVWAVPGDALGGVLDQRTSGALAGLLGGLAGVAILEIHCPNFNASHILIGHWGAALLCAGVGWVAGDIAARRALVGDITILIKGEGSQPPPTLPMVVQL